jgi:hypothetical protein
LVPRSVACPQQLRRKDAIHYHLSAASPTVFSEFLFPPRDGGILLQDDNHGDLYRIVRVLTILTALQTIQASSNRWQYRIVTFGVYISTYFARGQ